MRSKQLTMIIVSALSLLHITAGGTIRRKRRYAVSQGETSDDMDGIPILPLQNGPYGSTSQVKTSSYIDKGHGRQLKKDRSRRGDYRGERKSDYTEDNHEGMTAGSNVETLDLDGMTNEELEYYFEIQKAQSFPETSAPMARPESTPTSPSKPMPTPDASDPSSYPTAKASTSQPVTKPTKESLAPNTAPNISTPPPSPAPTTSRATSQPTPTAIETSAPAPPTPVPEADCEILTREDALMTVVEDVTDESVLNDASTPQAQAFSWLLEEDPAQIDPCTYPTPKQRYILATFYFATGGASWVASNGWLSADGECSWLGINCDDSGDVTKLELRDNNLSGSLPKELIALAFLRRLDVSGNIIEGSLVELPPTLSYLDVEENAMAGSPFESVLGLSDLKQLRISNNSFTGTIPTAIGTLEGLEELWIANNQFEGATIPSEIGNLKKLETLFIYDAQIGGSLPSELGRLDLNEFLGNNNKLLSSVPEELFANTGLTILRLDSNLITGTISRRIGDLVELVDLFLGNNMFAGTIPVTMLRLTSLVNLLLNDNALSGTIRDGFDDFLDLDFVDVSSNQLTGTIPSSLFGIRDLRFLYFSSNSLEGALPSTWSNAVLLRDLYLDNNLLSGQVPEIPSGAFARLTELLLNGNNFSGTMPNSICQLRTSAILEDLWADCSGTPPSVQCALPSCCTFCFE